MIRPVNRIVIVGGGTAGWLTAAYISNQMSSHTEILLVDKQVSDPIGVGEATILNFKQFMYDCGFKPEEWIPEIDATFKCGILFKDWQQEGVNLWHPFAFPMFNNLDSDLLTCWTMFKEYDYFTHACALYHPGVTENKVDPENIGTYAYHIDCGKLVRWVKGKLLRKIQLVEHEVISVDRNERGGLNHITIDTGEEIQSDIFIDCTGFKRLIAPEPDSVDCQGRLFCDTAVAGRFDYRNKPIEQNPYTTCAAVEHGWIWKTPTQERVGSGLVFNKSVSDVDEVKESFCKYWNNRVTPDELRLLDWTPYYHKNFWTDNVVTIGLSSGFIEPIESTGIALISAGAQEFVESCRGSFYDDSIIKGYNYQMTSFYESCIDFVNMHYAYNKRKTGKFWKYVQDTFKPSDKLLYYENEVLNNPVRLPSNGNYMFAGDNWSMFLCQMLDKDEILSKQSRKCPPWDADILVRDFACNERDKHVKSILHAQFIDQCLVKIRKGESLNIPYNG